MNAPVSIPTARVLREPPEGAEQLRAIPDHVPMPALPRLNGVSPAAVYDYRNADGSIAALIGRYEAAERKQILPLTIWVSPDEQLDWCCKSLPDERPLYRLPQMLADPDKIVLLSEGEKCADAVAEFTRYASVTWMGGCKALARTDFSPLAGRDVIILPDHDAPGIEAANQLTGILSEVGAASIRTLDIAGLVEACGLEAVPGVDIADAVAGGLDADWFEELLAMSDMLVETGAAPAEPVSASENLPTDPIQREVLTQFGIRPDDIPAVFSLTENGVIKHGADRNGRAADVYVGSPLVVLGQTRSARTGWGFLVALRTPASDWITRTIPARLLAGDGREMRELLADAGFMLPQDRAGRQGLAEYIGYAQQAPIIDLAARPGWHGDSFALPQGVIRPRDAQDDIRLDMADRQHFLSQSGSMAGWQELARLAEPNSRAAFSISAALAAPLLQPLNRTGGGFHLYGQSSRGKTTLLTLAGSVWGGGGNDGFVRNWRMTDNGAEGLLSDHNDLLLPLDELTTVAPETAAQINYLLANGQGKTRATKEGDARAAMQSRVLVLSSGENSFEQQIGLARGKTRMTGGLAVRMIDIPIEHDGESFENLSGFSSAGHLAEQMAMRAKTHYGHAGPAFLQAMIDRKGEVISEAEKIINQLMTETAQPGDDPQVRRAALQFGLVAAAGELAISAGILPWNDGAAFRAAAVCLNAWKAHRGGGASHEEREALSHLKAFFEMHGRTRFERILGSADQDADDSTARSDDHAVRDRCGFRIETDGEGTIFYVLPEAFRREVCAGHNPDLMIRIARTHAALIEGEGGRPQKKQRLPDYPHGTRVYALRPDLLP